MEKRPLEFHSVADVFPLMSGAQKEGFYRSIAQDGVVRPLVMFEGRILDGRNRYLAAVEAGIPLEDIPFRDFGSEVTDGDRPVDFVIRSNLHRRHLTDDQREMVAARIADLPRHRPQRPPGAPATKSDFAAPLSKTRDGAAKLLNVKPRGVKRARTIVRTGIPPLQEFVDEGRVSVRTGAEVAALPAQVQQQLVEGGPERVVQKVKELRQAREQSKLPKHSNPALAEPLAISPGATCSLILDGLPIVAVWTDKEPASWTNGEPLLFLKLPSSPAIPSGAVVPLEASAIYDELAQPYTRLWWCAYMTRRLSGKDVEIQESDAERGQFYLVTKHDGVVAEDVEALVEVTEASETFRFWNSTLFAEDGRPIPVPRDAQIFLPPLPDLGADGR